MNQRLSRASSLLACAVAALIATRFALLLSAGREHWIAFVPDDAFYYLGFGRGLVNFGQWTLDGGVSSSSGFHLLQAYAAALCCALFQGSADAAVYALMFLSVVCNLLAMLVCMRLVVRLFGEPAALAIPLVFLAKNALICGSSAMEWPLAVLALALATQLALVRGKPGPRQVLQASGLGLFAVLARSDSALWIGILAAASLLAHRWAGAARAAALLLGAMLGSLVVALHTHSITGAWLQDSVLAKLAWGAQRGADLPNALKTLAMATGVNWLGKGLDRAVLLALMLFGFVGAAVYQQEKRAALLASSSTLLLALALGARNSGGLQYWYTDAAVVPCCLLWSGVFSSAARTSLRTPSLLACLVSVSCVANLWVVKKGPWENQLATLRAAVRLTEKGWSACRVGSWNAGIFAYYRGQGVINLDGLANHDALTASKNGQLSTYLAKVHIQYVVDFAAMIERAEYRTRGGYDRPGQLLSLTEVERAPSSDPHWLGTSLVYWRLRPSASEAIPADCRNGVSP